MSMIQNVFSFLLFLKKYKNVMIYIKRLIIIETSMIEI